MSETTDHPSPGGDAVAIDPAARRRARLQFVAIIASFGIPLLLAIIWLQIVRAGGGGELGDTSRGELIEPAAPFQPFTLSDAEGEPVDVDTFRGLWTMLYVPAGECDEICERNLYHMRQVRLALNHRMTRVQRLVLPPAEAPLGERLIAEHPGLIVAGGAPDERATLVAQIAAAQSALPPIEDAIYLVDPFGNLMMRFAPDLPPKSMLKDVKHLLKVSRIG